MTLIFAALKVRRPATTLAAIFAEVDGRPWGWKAVPWIGPLWMASPRQCDALPAADACLASGVKSRPPPPPALDHHDHEIGTHPAPLKLACRPTAAFAGRRRRPGMVAARGREGQPPGEPAMRLLSSAHRSRAHACRSSRPGGLRNLHPVRSCRDCVGVHGRAPSSPCRLRLRAPDTETALGTQPFHATASRPPQTTVQRRRQRVGFALKRLCRSRHEDRDL